MYQDKAVIIEMIAEVHLGWSNCWGCRQGLGEQFCLSKGSEGKELNIDTRVCKTLVAFRDGAGQMMHMLDAMEFACQG